MHNGEAVSSTRNWLQKNLCWYWLQKKNPNQLKMSSKLILTVNYSKIGEHFHFYGTFQNKARVCTFVDDTFRILSAMRWFPLRTFQNRRVENFIANSVISVDYNIVFWTGKQPKMGIYFYTFFPLKRIILISRNLKTHIGKVFRGGPLSYRPHKVKFILWTS